jgi:hypothetical protein
MGLELQGLRWLQSQLQLEFNSDRAEQRRANQVGARGQGDWSTNAACGVHQRRHPPAVGIQQGNADIYHQRIAGDAIDLKDSIALDLELPKVSAGLGFKAQLGGQGEQTAKGQFDALGALQRPPAPVLVGGIGDGGASGPHPNAPAWRRLKRRTDGRRRGGVTSSPP